MTGIINILKGALRNAVKSTAHRLLPCHFYVITHFSSQRVQKDGHKWYHLMLPPPTPPLSFVMSGQGNLRGKFCRNV